MDYPADMSHHNEGFLEIKYDKISNYDVYEIPYLWGKDLWLIVHRAGE
jgi:hypothetical protein